MDDLEYTIKGKRILVTGGTGFIGLRLVRELLNCGAEVAILEDDESRIYKLGSLLTHPALSVFCCPMNDIDTLAAQRDKWGDIDCVAYLRLKISHADSFYEQTTEDIALNLLPTLNLTGVLRNSVQGFCFISSVAVYGRPNRVPVTETDPTYPTTLYGITKLAIENYLKAYQEKSQVPVTILRFATVFGPGEHKYRAIPNFLYSLTNGLPPVIYGDGSEVRDYVYIEDVVEATIQALLRRPAKIINIGSGKGFSTLQVARKLINLCSVNLEPKFKSRTDENTDIICDISFARDTLGYLPKTCFDDGLRLEVEEYLKEKSLLCPEKPSQNHHVSRTFCK